MSAREVAKKLGITFVDIEEFSCCGFPMKSASTETALLLTAKNLAVAAEKKMDICTLCNACTGVLTEANKELSENKELREKINEKLKDIDKKTLEQLKKVGVKRIKDLFVSKPMRAAKAGKAEKVPYTIILDLQNKILGGKTPKESENDLKQQSPQKKQSNNKKEESKK